MNKILISLLLFVSILLFFSSSGKSYPSSDWYSYEKIEIGDDYSFDSSKKLNFDAKIDPKCHVEDLVLIFTVGFSDDNCIISLNEINNETESAKLNDWFTKNKERCIGFFYDGKYVVKSEKLSIENGEAVIRLSIKNNSNNLFKNIFISILTVVLLFVLIVWLYFFLSRKKTKKFKDYLDKKEKKVEMMNDLQEEKLIPEMKFVNNERPKSLEKVKILINKKEDNRRFIDIYNDWLKENKKVDFSSIENIYNIKNLSFKDNKIKYSPNLTYFWLISENGEYYVFPAYNNLTPDYYKKIYDIKDIENRVNVALTKIVKIEKASCLLKNHDNTFSILEKGSIICSD